MARIIHDFMRYNHDVEHNLAGRIRDSLAPMEWELLQRVAEAAAELRLPLYVVGGFPRDLILGIRSSDFDLVVEGPADKLAQALADRFGGKVTIHDKFGTAKWFLVGSTFQDGKSESAERIARLSALDFVTARSEVYLQPGVLPTITLGTIEDDLRRRDFSINAIAIRLDGIHFGEVRDDLGGGRDLSSGVIRVLHDGSFTDDPTRMYRAVRYEQRYQFKIAAETLALIPAARGLIASLSPQRIRHELDLMLEEARAAPMVDRLAELDLLKSIHVALPADAEARARLARYEPQAPFPIPEWPSGELRWILWLLALPADQLEALNRRLHFVSQLLKPLLAASGLWSDLASFKAFAPSQWVERLDDVPHMAAYAVYLGLPAGEAKSAIGRYLADWRHVKPKTSGHDLKALGIERGPRYQSILRELRAAWLDGKVHNEAEEREYLQGILHRV